MSAASAPPAGRPAEAPLTGLALRVGAIASLAAMAAAIKLGTGYGVSTPELVFYRTLFAVPVILLWVAIGPGFGSLATRRPRAHAARALLGLASLTANFSAVALLPLAEATALGFAAPLFATGLSALLLGERVGRARWIAVAVGFCGVLVVARPSGAEVSGAGVAVGIVAALCTASVHVTMRQIGATEPATTTVFWFTAISLVATGAVMPFLAHWPPPAAWPVLIAIGLFGGCTQMMITASVRYAPLSTLVSLDYTQLVWSALLGWWLFANVPAPATLAGGAVIAASGLFIAWRERRRTVTLAASPEPEM